MKKSYKLIGVFWDGKPIPNTKPIIRQDEKTFNHNSSIPLSNILSLDDSEIESFSTEKYESILVDNIPTYSKTVLKFYTKRLLQIMEYFKLPVKCCNVQFTKLLNETVRFYLVA